jgi:hypothetical protein
VDFSQLRDSPIFICGHPKSGTTLVRAILDSHPQLVVYPDETFFFQGFTTNVANRTPDMKLSLGQRYLLHFFEAEGETPEQRFTTYARTCEAMRVIIENNGCRHDGDLLSAAILAYGQNHGFLTPESRYWVEKTPYNEFFADDIYALWPEARCIHIVRDPRDNFTTYYKKHPDLAVERFALGWNASLKAGLRNLKRYGSQRYLILRYEDLTQDPEKQLSLIVNFLGIRDDKSLRLPSRAGVVWQGNSMFGDKFTGISNKPLDRWKQNLSPKDEYVIETLSGSLMKKQGYPYQGKLALGQYLHTIYWMIKQAREIPRVVTKALKRNFGMFPQ